MIADYIYKKAKIVPESTFIIIDNISFSFKTFNKTINQIYVLLNSIDEELTRIKINLSCPLLRLSALVACNRLNKIPILFPDESFLIKTFNYNTEAKIDFDLAHSSNLPCIKGTLVNTPISNSRPESKIFSIVETSILTPLPILFTGILP